MSQSDTYILMCLCHPSPILFSTSVLRTKLKEQRNNNYYFMCLWVWRSSHWVTSPLLLQRLVDSPACLPNIQQRARTEKDWITNRDHTVYSEDVLIYEIGYMYNKMDKIVSSYQFLCSTRSQTVQTEWIGCISRYHGLLTTTVKLKN